jgi:peroxiredoxin
MLKKTFSVIGYLILCVSLGLVIRHFTLTHSPTTVSTNASKTLFASTLMDAQQRPQALKQWQGKIIVLNFWATWCPPCREEMPELSRFYSEQQQNNVVVLGIAVDGSDAVNTFTKEHPVSYPLLVDEDGGMDLAAQFGNDKDILPYTVIIAPDGSVTDTFFGRISKSKLESSLNKLR